MLVGLSLNRSHHGQMRWTDLGVIMDNWLLAIADDLVKKYSSPTRTCSKCRNLELMSSILSYKPGGGGGGTLGISGSGCAAGTLEPLT